MRLFKMICLVSLVLSITAFPRVAISENLINKKDAYLKAAEADCPTDGINIVQDADSNGWNFYKCNCTSYVAFRLNELGIKFNNFYRGPKWGDALNWCNAAKQLNIKIDNTPTKGAVAWKKQIGHVAYIDEKPGEPRVFIISEYNFNNKFDYEEKTLSETKISDYYYIHIDPDNLENENSNYQGIDCSSSATIPEYKTAWQANEDKLCHTGRVSCDPYDEKAPYFKVTKGENFDKQWGLKNTGTKPWDLQNCTFTCDDTRDRGTQPKCSELFPVMEEWSCKNNDEGCTAVETNGSHVFKVNMQLSSSINNGKYEKWWVLKDKDGKLITSGGVNIQIEVTADTTQPPVTPPVNQPECNVSDAQCTFMDLKNTLYDESYILDLCKRCIVKIPSDGKFRPNDFITRAELLKMALLGAGHPYPSQSDENSSSAFCDIPAGHWATGFINYAKMKEIAKGYEIFEGKSCPAPPDPSKKQDMFRPEALIVRAEALKIILESFKESEKLSGSLKDLDNVDVTNLLQKAEDINPNDWHIRYIAIAFEKGIMCGTPIIGTTKNKFRPNDPATRGEVATMIYKAIHLVDINKCQ